MTKPLVIIELDEYNKLINNQKTSNDFLNLFLEIETEVRVIDYPDVINNFTAGYNIIINKKKIRDALIEAYGITHISNIELK